MASGDSKDSRNNAPSYTPAAPWAKLRAWVDKHEAWEREHGEAANLHDKERAAVSTLVPLFTTPQMDETNYVGVLSNFISNRSIQVYYDDRSLSVWANGAPKHMWQVFATVVDLNENNDLIREKFPRDDMNPKSGDDLIVFDNKKQAKQYAAMCVLRFLKPDVVPEPEQPSQMGPAPRDTAEQATTAAVTQSAKRQAGKALGLAPAIKKQCTESSGEAAPEPDPGMQEPVALTDPASTSLRRPSLTTTTPHTTAAVSKEAARSLDGMLSSARISENGTSVSSDQIQALELATSMGLGSPQYVVKPDGDNPGCFSGYASLQPGSRAPARLAFVRNASSKAEATSKIAEELHGWLKKEWQRRVDLRSTFIKDIVAVGT